MHPHHPVEADEGAGSLKVTDGTFGGEDSVDGLSFTNGGEGVMVAVRAKFGISKTGSIAVGCTLAFGYNFPLRFHL